MSGLSGIPTFDPAQLSTLPLPSREGVGGGEGVSIEENRVRSSGTVA